MSEYSKKEREALIKANEILTEAGRDVEFAEGDMQDNDGLERWCIHPGSGLCFERQVPNLEIGEAGIKKEIQKEILSLYDEHIDNGISAMQKDYTVTEIAKECILNFEQTREREG